MNTTQLVLMVLSIAIFCGIGTICIVGASAVQQYALRLYENRESAQRFNPFWKWMQRPGYLLSIRLAGCVALLMALMILFGLLFPFKR